MPNIELHGYGNRSRVMRVKIRKAIASSPEIDEIITSVCQTDPRDQGGAPRPYLRVIIQPQDLPNFNDLKRRLALLNEDIEVVPLLEWIPRKIFRK